MKKRILFVFFIYIMLITNLGQLLYSEEKSLIQQARELINAKKYEEAIPVLQQAQNEAPNSVEINLTLGLLCLEVERYFIAEDCFLRILSVDPNSISAHYSLAMIYEKNKKFSEAIKEWEKVISITTNKPLIEFCKKHIKFAELQLK